MEFVAIAISDYFNIYPYPKTGSVRDATAVFTYEGKRNTEIDSVLNALADIVGITMETAWERETDEEKEKLSILSSQWTTQIKYRYCNCRSAARSIWSLCAYATIYIIINNVLAVDFLSQTCNYSF